jgi:hypothetical protein
LIGHFGCEIVFCQPPKAVYLLGRGVLMPTLPTSNCRTGVIILCVDNYSQEILDGLTEQKNKELEG